MYEACARTEGTRLSLGQLEALVRRKFKVSPA